MKFIFLTLILASAMLSYGQQPAIPGSNSPPGAYTPHPNPAGMDAPPPAEQRPQDVLMQDPKLVAKLQKLLPEGTTPRQFCDGFKTLGGCVTAMYAAKDMEIPVSDLKAKIVEAKSKKEPDKLETAIHELKPNVDAKAERKKAQKQAERDLPVSN